MLSQIWICIYDKISLVPGMKSFGRGSSIKSGEEKDELMNEIIDNNGVCRAAPGFARVC